jgi:hypothetical protein
MFERSWGDARAFDERVDIVALQAKDATHPVGGQFALIDEPIEGAGGDTEAPGGFLGAHPDDVRGCGWVIGVTGHDLRVPVPVNLVGFRAVPMHDTLSAAFEQGFSSCSTKNAI